jgi:murein L,D-transpeptidase YafK
MEVSAQSSASVRNYYSFLDYQKSFPRPSEAMQRKEDTIQKQFAAKGLVWPAKYVYIRSFKYDSQLEVWVKDKVKEPFKLFKSYKICALAGSLGPKRMQGDFQVPEGFYYINEFNPNSSYYLSLGLNYPNESDKVLSDSLNPGGDIYIHGSCVTVGCIPITDQQIDELYIIATHAKDVGQDFIPVHIFPCRFDVEKSVNYLETVTKDDSVLKRFSVKMQEAFDYFEKYHQTPVVMIAESGEYYINGGFVSSKPVVKKDLTAPAIRKISTPHRVRNVSELTDPVQVWPQYAKGAEQFALFLDEVGHSVAEYLPTGIKKAYIQMEFIIDRDGLPVNFKVMKGITGADQLVDELITRLEKMENWKPALFNNKPVPKKMIQTITVQPK